MIQTHSSPPQVAGELPTPIALESVVKASWTEADEVIFIQYIGDRKSEAGDGMKFKALFWTAVAATMQPLTMQGGPKTAAGCSAKWDRVRSELLCLQCDFAHTSVASSRRPTMSSLFSKTCQDSLGLMIGGSM
jgi:hypothetical protein